MDSSLGESRGPATPSTAEGEAASHRQPILEYVAPFAAFSLIGFAESQPVLRPYYIGVYTAKLMVVCTLLWWFRKSYPPFRSNGLALAAVVGVLGTVAWVLLSAVDLAAYLPDIIRGWLVGSRVGFSPTDDGDLVTWILAATIRVLGLALVVPVMEEIFWRGFLLRFVVREPFHLVPIGTYTLQSFAIVVGAFTLAHTEWLAAAVWCAAINLLLYRTRNLWAAVLAHAVTNALLGAYILAFKQWHLW